MAIVPAAMYYREPLNSLAYAWGKGWGWLGNKSFHLKNVHRPLKRELRASK